MTQSKISAKAAALTVLGYHLRTAPGLSVTAVLPSKPAGKVLQTGDQILAADGQVLKLRPISPRSSAAIGSAPT